MVFEAAAFQVNVGALQHADLTSSQAVAVGGEKNSVVSFVFDRGEKPTHLVLGEIGDEAVGRGVRLLFCWGGLGHMRQNVPSVF